MDWVTVIFGGLSALSWAVSDLTYCASSGYNIQWIKHWEGTE